MIARMRAAARQPGQVLVIFAVLVPVLVALLGFGIDAAHLYRERRQLQNTADLAALGGASQLPDDVAAARSIALDLAARNGHPGDSVDAVAGYGGNDTRLLVTARREVETFFMSILGIDRVAISARAVAEHASGAGTSVFVKKDTHCWTHGIYWPGNNITVAGDAHSNAAMTVTGSNNTLDGSLTYKTGCQGNVTTSGTNPNMPSAQAAPWRDWPEKFTPADFPCTVRITNPDLRAAANYPLWESNNPSSKRLRTGTICYDGSGTLTLTDTGVSGTVTLRARNIRITGTNFNLSPHRNGVLIYSTGNSFPSMVLDMTGGTLNGMLYNKLASSGSDVSGQIDITGRSGFRLNGTIITWSVVLRGSNWQISGTLDAEPEPMHLVE